MYITLQMTADTPKHTAVKHVSANQWGPANDTTSLIGVTLEDAYQDPDTGLWWAPVVISGQDIFLTADAAIPDEGGFLHIRNGGRAYVDNSSTGCGTVAPRNIGEPERVAGSLIFVHMR